MKSLEPPSLDLMFAGVGACLSVAITIYAVSATGRLLYVVVGILTLTCCLTWLYLHSRPLSGTPQRLPDSRSRRLALATAFVLLFTASLISVYVSSDSYLRPPTYFVLTALMVSVIFVEVLLDSHSRMAIGTILTQIVVLGLSLVVTQSLAFPNLVGVDPWWHRWFVTQLLRSGHIPTNSTYSVFPIFHLEIASTMLSTGLDYKIATLASISFLLIALDSVLVYLIGRQVLTERVGLLAALMLAVGSFNLQMGFWPIPNTLAVTEVLLCVYLVLKPATAGALRLRGAAIAFMALLILTHPIASVMMVLILFLGWTTFTVARMMSRAKIADSPVSITLAMLFGVFMFGWWAYTSGYPFEAISDWVRWGFSIDAFLNTPRETLAYAGSVPIAEQILSLFGPMLFFSLSMIGGLSMISRTLGSRTRGFLAIVGVGAAALPFLSVLSGHSIVEGRWWFLAMVFLSIPLALTLIFITQLGRRKSASTFFATCLVTALALVMITSPTANIDNHTLYHDTSVRTALTTGEIDSAVTAYNLFHKTIATDAYYYSRIQFLGVDASSLTSQLYSGKFNETSQMLLIRTETIGNPFYISSSTSWKLPYDPVTRLDDQQSFSRVFDSGAAVGYLSTG